MQIRHIGIVTQDIRSSINFYCDLLGGNISRKMEESGSFISTVLGKKNVEVTTIKLNFYESVTQLELLSFTNPKVQGKPSDLFSSGLTHFAMTVKDLMGLYQRMLEKGISFITEPLLSEDGLARVCFCQDPNGVYIELVELLSP